LAESALNRRQPVVYKGSFAGELVFWRGESQPVVKVPKCLTRYGHLSRFGLRCGMDAECGGACCTIRDGCWQATRIALRQWFAAHVHNPYPNSDTLPLLAKMTGLNFVQVNHWLTNERYGRPQFHVTLRPSVVVFDPDILHSVRNWGLYSCPQCGGFQHVMTPAQAPARKRKRKSKTPDRKLKRAKLEPPVSGNRPPSVTPTASAASTAAPTEESGTQNSRAFGATERPPIVRAPRSPSPPDVQSNPTDFTSNGLTNAASPHSPHDASRADDNRALSPIKQFKAGDEVKLDPKTDVAVAPAAVVQATSFDGLNNKRDGRSEDEPKTTESTPGASVSSVGADLVLTPEILDLEAYLVDHLGPVQDSSLQDWCCRGECVECAIRASWPFKSGADPWAMPPALSIDGIGSAAATTAATIPAPLSRTDALRRLVLLLAYTHKPLPELLSVDDNHIDMGPYFRTNGLYSSTQPPLIVSRDVTTRAAQLAQAIRAPPPDSSGTSSSGTSSSSSSSSTTVAQPAPADG
jgi:hypothetical protein